MTTNRIVQGVARSGLLLGDIAVLDGSDLDVQGTLYAAGARAGVIFTGVNSFFPVR